MEKRREDVSQEWREEKREETNSTLRRGPILVSLVTMSKWPEASDNALDKLIRN
jgi:hypothetical protein